jgi:hypothetical protein
VAVAATVIVGVAAASGRTHKPALVTATTSAFGYGTYNATTGNQFFFEASSATNGSGGSGTITLTDPSTQHFIGATVSCLFVDPTTGEATIWGNVTDPNTNSFPPGPSGSVLIVATPGSGSSAGYNVRSFYTAAPTTCNGNGLPAAGPIAAGVVQTNAGP